MISASVTIIILVVIAVFFFSAAVRVFREYERGIMFTFGRYTGTKGPGFVLMIPLVQQIVRVDLRIIVTEVPPQDVISHDNVSVRVSAVIYFRVVDAERAVIQVKDFIEATSQLSQTTLRSVLGKHDLDEMLAERDKLNTDVREVLDQQTDAWGIKVSNVEIKRIDLDESMVRAIARQAEAERNRRAKVINALGEEQAAQKLLDAARILAPVPQAMQLRYLATLFDIAGDKSSTIVFPFPIELMRLLAQIGGSEGVAPAAAADDVPAGDDPAGVEQHNGSPEA
ncbi:MAG TPA: slipin family protein [Acetobacteraceae bacterium]|jgi:regulator of protease activity HflC (stomatin/prohibitin superfamily)|nr:slipin family protein [Acetobacteraceae bacterium]